MKTALIRDMIREIRRSFGRFAAIFAIVLLGVSFFAGVCASPYDMETSADSYFDTYALQDIRLVSSIGFNDEDLEAIREADDVLGACGVHSMDLLITSEDSETESVAAVTSIPADTSDGNDNYINRFRIYEGRLPENGNECLVRYSTARNQPIQVGDVLTLKTGTDEDLNDVLKVKKVTVVGIAYTPASISFSLGSSKIGNGNVSYLMYLPEEDFKEEYYTSVYVTVDGAEDLNCFRQAYFDYVQTAEDSLAELGAERIAARTEEMKQTLYDAVAEEVTEEVTKEAREQVGERVQEEIENQTKTAVEDAVTEEIEKEVKNEVTDAVKAELAEKVRAEVTSQVEAQIASKVREELTAQVTAQVNQAVRAQVETQVRANTEEIREEIRTAIENKENDVTDGILKLMIAAGYISADWRSDVTATADSLTERVIAYQIDQTMDSSEVKARIAQEITNAVEANYPAAYQSACGQYLNAYVEENYPAAYAQAEALYLQGYVDQAYDQALQTAMDEHYDEAVEEAYGDALDTAMDENYDKAVEENLGTAVDAVLQENIDQVYAEQLEKNFADADSWQWYVLDRNYCESYAQYAGAIDTMRTISTLFPAFFIFVAALVCFTTMTRMVDEERGTIGTYKALGYTQKDIVLKYLVYALSASVLGGVLGCLLGLRIYPVIIYNSWAIAYQMPAMLQADTLVLCIISVTVMTAVTAAAALLACMQDLRADPTALMRPKAPKLGKKVWMEYIPGVWKHLSFSWKVTIRNIFRYKKRFYMTLVGVAGCTALLMVGFGVSDSISGLISKQYGEIIAYNTTATLADDLTVSQRKRGLKYIEDTGEFESGTALYAKNGYAGLSKSSAMDDDESVTIYAVEDAEGFEAIFKLCDAETGKRLQIPDSGIIISKRLSQLLNAEEGDRIYVENGDGIRKKIKVSAVCEMYVNHYVIMSADTYRETFGETPEKNTFLAVCNADDDTKSELSTDLMAHDEIASVTFIGNSIKTINSMMTALKMITWVLIAASGLLAFVVLYNLSNVNISERIREIATIKVLGFYDGEVYTYVYREAVIITMFGALLGLPLGMLLHRTIMGAISMDTVYFGHFIAPVSYLYSFLLTVGFSLIVSFFIHLKLRKIPMVESLKSVE